MVTVSVIIVTVDRPDDVRRCLESFTLPAGSDAIVVDSSRGDETARVVANFPRARYLKCEIRNRCVQRNRGIEASQNDVVLFLDDDCVAQPGWIPELLAGYTEDNIHCVVGCIREVGLQEFPPDQGPFQTAFGPTQPITNWPCPAPMEVLNGQGGNMSFRRAALLAIGGFDPNYLGTSSGEENDTFIRIRRNGGRIMFMPKSVTQHCPAKTTGFKRSSADRRFMYWLGYNHAYGNTKLFLGRRTFFWYWIWDTLRFLVSQLGRLGRAIVSNLLVTLWHLGGRLNGFIHGIKWHLKK